jgi:hypothetical protein
MKPQVIEGSVVIIDGTIEFLEEDVRIRKFPKMMPVVNAEKLELVSLTMT